MPAVLLDPSAKGVGRHMGRSPKVAAVQIAQPQPLGDTPGVVSQGREAQAEPQREEEGYLQAWYVVCMGTRQQEGGGA